MRLITHFKKQEDFIKKSIRKYAHCAEHNFYHYKFCEGDGEKNYLFKLNNKKTILSSYSEYEDIWNLFPSGILAPKEEQYSLFLKFLDHALNKEKVHKVCVEVNQDLRKLLLKKLKKHENFRMCKNYDILYWPVYNLNKFDSLLRGKNWKKIRNIRNRFYKKHDIKITDSRRIPKEKLLTILNTWLKKRNATDTVDKYYYENLIKSNFEGMDMAKTIVVDGKPSSITCGWKIPRTNNYYSSIGILDYSIPGLGEVANIEDLKLLKEKGYDYADFGGSDKVLLYFKKKFRPESIYKTYIFSIMPRKKRKKK